MKYGTGKVDETHACLYNCFSDLLLLLLVLFLFLYFSSLFLSLSLSSSFLLYFIAHQPSTSVPLLSFSLSMYTFLPRVIDLSKYLRTYLCIYVCMYRSVCACLSISPSPHLLQSPHLLHRTFMCYGDRIEDTINCHSPSVVSHNNSRAPTRQ